MQEEIDKLKEQLAAARAQRNTFEQASIKAHQRFGKLDQWLFMQIEEAIEVKRWEGVRVAYFDEKGRFQVEAFDRSNR